MTGRKIDHRFKVSINGRTLPVEVPGIIPPFYRIVINDTHDRAWLEEAVDPVQEVWDRTGCLPKEWDNLPKKISGFVNE